MGGRASERSGSGMNPRFPPRGEGGKSATVEMDGEKIYCALLSEGEFEVMEAKHLYDGHYQHDQRDNSDVTKLTVKFKGVKNISVAITPMEGGVAPTELPEDKALAEW